MNRLRNVALSAFAVLLCANLSVSACRAQEKLPTAREVIAAIQDHVGVPWNPDTVDTIKAGNPDTPGYRNCRHHDGDDGRPAARRR